MTYYSNEDNSAAWDNAGQSNIDPNDQGGALDPMYSVATPTSFRVQNGKLVYDDANSPWDGIDANYKRQGNQWVPASQFIHNAYFNPEEGGGNNYMDDGARPIPISSVTKMDFGTLDGNGQPKPGVVPNVQDYIDMFNYRYAGQQDQGYTGFERPWTYDAESTQRGQGILDGYKAAVDSYNKQTGQNVPYAVNDVAHLPVSQYQASMPAEQKGESSMIGGILHDPASLALLSLASAGTLQGLTAGAGAAAAPGWVSAEGGAGYLGGLAADSAALSGAAGAAGAAGIDQIGSDWAAGQATGAVGGTLPTTAEGLTAANAAAGTIGGTGGTLADLLKIPTSEFTQPGVDQVGSDWATGQATGSAGGLLPQTAEGLTAANGAGLAGAAGAGAAGAGSGTGGAVDQVGSDWATGQATGATGGLLPQTVGGLTAANTVAGTISAASSAGTALSRILNGTGTADDWLKVGGTGLSTILGAVKSSNQSGALSDLAAKYDAYGAPSRARYEASFQPGFSMSAADPGYSDALNSTSDGLLRRLSATGGNPYGNPGGLIEANKQIDSSLALPALQNYRNQNAATGGYSAFNTAAPAAATGAIGSSGGTLATLGAGISDLINPKSQQYSLSDLLKLVGTNLS